MGLGRYGKQLLALLNLIVYIDGSIDDSVLKGLDNWQEMLAGIREKPVHDRAEYVGHALLLKRLYKQDIKMF